MIHECFAEVIERLFCEAIVQSIPSDLEINLKVDLVLMDVGSITTTPFSSNTKKCITASEIAAIKENLASLHNFG